VARRLHRRRLRDRSVRARRVPERPSTLARTARADGHPVAGCPTAIDTYGRSSRPGGRRQRWTTSSGGCGVRPARWPGTSTVCCAWLAGVGLSRRLGPDREGRGLATCITSATCLIGIAAHRVCSIDLDRRRWPGYGLRSSLRAGLTPHPPARGRPSLACARRAWTTARRFDRGRGSLRPDARQPVRFARECSAAPARGGRERSASPETRLLQTASHLLLERVVVRCIRARAARRDPTPREASRSRRHPA